MTSPDGAVSVFAITLLGCRSSDKRMTDERLSVVFENARSGGRMQSFMTDLKFPRKLVLGTMKISVV